MKKFVSLALTAMLATSAVAGLASCGEDKKYTVGMICLHGDESTYDKNFIDAMKTACKNKGISDELTIVTGVPETTECYETAKDLVDQGCDVIFADSFGHEKHMLKAAKEFPDVEFCHATGTTAHTENVSNFHNAFASIYEGRYLAGVAAGMKLVEMHKAGTLKDGNYADAEKTVIKMGYVGAFTYAEVISGYTSFYLGAKSIVKEKNLDISMEVQFTGSWYDETEERNSALTLINNGAALISQHADSMGAPSACEEKGIPNVSYNGSTQDSCPNTYIVSSRINWVPYFEYIIDCTLNDKKIDTDWTGSLSNESVVLTSVNDKAAASGTQAKIDEVKGKLIAGEINVFDTATFTVGGIALTSYMADVDTDAAYTKDTEVIENGIFYESKHRSAPYFDIQIDGIVLLNDKR